MPSWRVEEEDARRASASYTAQPTETSCLEQRMPCVGEGGGTEGAAESTLARFGEAGAVDPADAAASRLKLALTLSTVRESSSSKNLLGRLQAGDADASRAAMAHGCKNKGRRREGARAGMGSKARTEDPEHTDPFGKESSNKVASVMEIQSTQTLSENSQAARLQV